MIFNLIHFQNFKKIDIEIDYVDISARSTVIFGKLHNFIKRTFLL